MAETIEDLIGSQLVIGFPGKKVTSEVLKHFRDLHAGGVIFYWINIESAEQIKRMISDLESGLGRRLLVTVDHEGGRVVMYRDGVTQFPDNLTIGHSGDLENARIHGEVAAKELRALGTDVNFAPVLDVLTKAYSPNIGIRSFGEDWSVVAKMGAAYIKALQAGGVSATAKHFPGKGHAPVDAHLKLPTIMSTWDEMNAVHLKPFIAAIEAGVDVIMSSHPYYPRLDPAKNQIATFSRRIITDCLRDELGFKGVIASDDLEMGAVKDVAPIGTAAVKAAAAGHDLILSCHSWDDQRACFEALREAYKGKLLSTKELEASVDRINALKAKRPNRFEGKIGPVPGADKTARRIADAAVQVYRDSKGILPLSKTLSADVGVIFPRVSEFGNIRMNEKEFDDEELYLDTLFGNYPGNHVTEIYGIEPTEEDIDDAVNLSRRSSVTLFFCFDAHLHPRQGLLLASLQKSARQLIVIMMRDPYDLEFLRGKDIGVTAFGYRKCQIEACVSRIFGE